MRPFDRRPVKNINLGLIYAEGVAALALKNGQSFDETKKLKEAILAMYPGLKEMYRDMKRRAKAGEPIITWGGRAYLCEPPSIVKGRIQEWDYKMVNVLIQGSAADCTKEAMIRIAERIKRMHNRGWFMLLQVHDEIVLSVPIEDLAEAQEMMREEMESVEFDVKILSEGAYSKDNWARMVDWDKKGMLV
jgi:DNA polymerase-1